jgi:hypothetical protein
MHRRRPPSPPRGRGLEFRRSPPPGGRGLEFLRSSSPRGRWPEVPQSHAHGLLLSTFCPAGGRWLELSQPPRGPRGRMGYAHVLRLSAFCFLPSAYCFLPSAFCLHEPKLKAWRAPGLRITYGSATDALKDTLLCTILPPELFRRIVQCWR